jgi:hypothetical protein
MKFLVIPSFASINSVLNKFDNGESVILGRVEGYSCKAAGDDKKLFKKLNTSLEHQLNIPAGSDSHGPGTIPTMSSLW